jgi:hypothetical protein
MDTLNIDHRFTPEEIGETTALIYANALSKIPIGKMLFTETKKVSKPRSAVNKITAWLNKLFEVLKWVLLQLVDQYIKAKHTGE